MKSPLPYSEFRTGLTFADVARMYYEAEILPHYLRYVSGAPIEPRYMSRGGVLWHFRQIKQDMYAEYCASFDVERIA